MRYRRLDLDMPMPLWDRLKAALEKAQDTNLIPVTATERDFLLATVVVNGLAMVESDLKNRERKDSLVLTPEEAVKEQKELRRAGLANRT